jgi:MoaA/NifB/PqqE/SkfB family radical SAM enzyme
MNNEETILLKTYQNGNYHVAIFSDGTKIKSTKDDKFIADFPENIDIKLTNKCSYGCLFCHENSVPNGIEGKLLNEDNFYYSFFKTLHAGTELALGGGALTTINHLDFTRFLALLKDEGVITNITINEYELEKNLDYIQKLVDTQLVHGVGVSYNHKSDIFMNFCKKNPNTVVHIINGIATKDDIEYLQNNNLKLLILGYKDFRRGINYRESYNKDIEARQSYLKEHLPEIFNNFNVVSFDNLALEQLEVKNLLSPEDWEEFYMGDDGTATMYIDLVKEQYAKNSTTPEDQRKSGFKDTIEELFADVKVN